jgi:hypothetical protein
MSISLKSLSLGAVLAATIAVADVHANAADQNPRVTQTAAAAVTLPPVVVHPTTQPSWYYDPYTSGHAQRPSSLNHIPFSHYKVPVGYDANVAMHPYTSGMGPCTDNAQPAQGCRHPQSTPIPSSGYERAPFNQ